jgi:hypothetical protein
MDECGTSPYPPNPTIPPAIDEGLMKPVPYTILLPPVGFKYVPCGGQGTILDTVCGTAQWGSEIDLWINTGMGGYLNILFDWNRNGVWGGNVICGSKKVPEHAVWNHPLQGGYSGPVSGLLPNPPPIDIGPIDGYVWARFSLTEAPVPENWDGSGQFFDGETEDYLILIGERPEIPLSGWAIFLAIGLITLLTLFIWWRRR